MIKVLFGFQISTLHKEHCSCNSTHPREQSYLSASAYDTDSQIHQNNSPGCRVVEVYTALGCVLVGFFGGWLVGGFCGFEVLFKHCLSQPLCIFPSLSGAKAYAQAQHLTSCLAPQHEPGQNWVTILLREYHLCGGPITPSVKNLGALKATWLESDIY